MYNVIHLSKQHTHTIYAILILLKDYHWITTPIIGEVSCDSLQLFWLAANTAEAWWWAADSPTELGNLALRSDLLWVLGDASPPSPFNAVDNWKWKGLALSAPALGICTTPPLPAPDAPAAAVPNLNWNGSEVPVSWNSQLIPKKGWGSDPFWAA